MINPYFLDYLLSWLLADFEEDQELPSSAILPMPGSGARVRLLCVASELLI